jgi:hypothetical protein
MKFEKFGAQIFITESSTNNDPKTLFFIKIRPRRPEKSSIECQKRVKSTESNIALFPSYSTSISCDFTRFWTYNWRYLQFRRQILMEDSVLESLLVALSVIKIWTQNFSNFIAKFGSKVEISWKLRGLKWHFANNSEVSSYFLGHILLFWKVMMQTIP